MFTTKNHVNADELAELEKPVVLVMCKAASSTMVLQQSKGSGTSYTKLQTKEAWSILLRTINCQTLLRDYSNPA